MSDHVPQVDSIEDPRLANQSLNSARNIIFSLLDTTFELSSS